jgi:hypothetical protein
MLAGQVKDLQTTPFLAWLHCDPTDPSLRLSRLLVLDKGDFLRGSVLAPWLSVDCIVHGCRLDQDDKAALFFPSNSPLTKATDD